LTILDRDGPLPCPAGMAGHEEAKMISCQVDWDEMRMRQVNWDCARSSGTGQQDTCPRADGTRGARNFT
jgi:hypothetical protein